MPNRLIGESSPYLLEHAHNPVDWYPWGQEALRRAREEDRPILLSVGYAACHWCHVMRRESFEDPETARIINERFVPVKVDREERPDIDAIYMQAVQALTGQGGWPLTVFLTPDLRPFFGGTYFPPADRGGLPSFRRVLLAVSQAYRERRGDVERIAGELSRRLAEAARPRPSGEPLTTTALEEAFQGLASAFDPQFGGFGTAPKFPQPLLHEFLLFYHHTSGNQLALSMVEVALERMARGGIYDHLGGGFHRYATDPFWLVPHFEKMLYDNALLARLYLHAYQLTGRPLYREVCQQTLDYLLREMRSPQGAFFSSQDAESEGEEGRFYLWTREEVLDALGNELGEFACRYFGVAEKGPVEGRCVLWVARPPEEMAGDLGLPLEEVASLIARAREGLRRARSRRPHPDRDEKVLAGWNGLALQALAEAGPALGRPDYLEAAERQASFLMEALVREGRLMRSWRDGRTGPPAYLEDYAMLGLGLLALYEATLHRQWLDWAVRLAQQMTRLFWDGASGAFYDTGADQEAPLTRPRDFLDNAHPCGGSAATTLLLRLATTTGDDALREKALLSLRAVRPFMSQIPLGMGQWLWALAFYLTPTREVAIIGPAREPSTISLLSEVHRRFLPNRVVAGADPSRPGDASGLPLLEGKGMVGGRPTAYVCQNYTCQEPVTEAEDLARQLQAPPRAQG